jgi:serine/threonine protein kinase
VDTWSCGVILYTLLAGCLPFDEEVIPALFKKIKAAEYTIPDHFSLQARDLIKRMLEPNQVNRMKFHDIRKHPWFKEYFPLYRNVRNFANRFDNFKIDEEIFGKILNMDFVFNSKDVEDIRSAIKKGKDYSFVIAYDLMVDDQRKHVEKESGKEIPEEERLYSIIPVSQMKKVFEDAFTSFIHRLNRKTVKFLESDNSTW